MTTHTSATSPLARGPVAAPQRRLGLALRIDGFVTIPMALGFLIFAPTVQQATGINEVALRLLGGFLMALAATFIVVGRATPLSVSAACGLIAVNLAWVALSVLALTGVWWDLTVLGAVLVVAQAVVVAILVVIESVAGYGMARAAEEVG